MRASSPQSLSGIELYIAAILLAIANFVVVLDMTVANVSVSHIAGGLAISLNEGTYVITSYAVAEAIIVPLTGWLAGRFGEVRVFINCIIWHMFIDLWAFLYAGYACDRTHFARTCGRPTYAHDTNLADENLSERQARGCRWTVEYDDTGGACDGAHCGGVYL